MQLLQDGLVAALAAAGLASILWLVFSALRCPRPAACADADAVLRCADAAALERTVGELLRARYEGRCFRRIVILTDGLGGESRAVAEILGRENFAVELLSAADYAAELAAASAEQTAPRDAD